MHINNFKNHLLIAMPSLQNEFFTKAVILIYDHSEDEGAIGFTINKPLSATLGNVLEHLKIEVSNDHIYDLAVFSGGPVGPDQGFVIHDRMTLAENSDDCEITISTSREILAEIADGKGPNNFIVSLGYAGWEPGQLEAEIMQNDWLLVPFNKDILFETPIAERWNTAAKAAGIDIQKLSGQIGHA